MNSSAATRDDLIEALRRFHANLRALGVEPLITFEAAYGLDDGQLRQAAIITGQQLIDAASVIREA